MKILVLHGPNLNMLGKREPHIYGSKTLADIDRSLHQQAQELGISLEIMQSNLEGLLLTAIQESVDKQCNGIIINPGAYGHTSIALRDAFLSVDLPFVEVHISNTFAREKFRNRSYISDLASGIVIGFGANGYLYALQGLVNLLNGKQFV